MHEAKLVDDIVAKALDVARENGQDKIEGVSIEIGALNHATPESLAGMLNDAVSSTALEGAEFAIEKSTDMDAPSALDVRLVSMTIGGG